MTGARSAIGDGSWWRYLVVAEAAAVGAVVVPGPIGIALGVGVGLSAIAALLVGRRRWAGRHGRPWTVLAVALASFLAGHVVRVLHQARSGGDAIPSPADLLFLAGYVLVAVAVVDLLRRRSPHANAPVVAETLVIAVAAVVLSWTHLLAPSLAGWLAGSRGGWELAVLWLRPLADVVLVSLAARLGAGGRLHTPAWRLAGLALLGLVVGDTTWALTHLDVAQVPEPLSLLGSLTGYAAAGATALHPSMARLAARIPDPSARPTRARLLVLGGAALAVPVSLLLRTVRTDPVVLGPALAGTCILFMLVLWRLTLLVAVLERSAALHRFMRHAGAALVGARGDDLPATAVRALQQLLDDDRRRVSLALAPADGDEQPLVVHAAAGADADRAPGTTLALERLPAWARAALDAGQHVAATAAALDLPDQPTAPAAVLCVPLRAGERLRGIVTVTGGASADEAGADSGASAVEAGAGTGARLDEATEDALLEYTAALSLALERAALDADVARRRGERRFATLVQHASDAILIVDAADAVVRYASPATRALLGLEADAVTGLPLTVVLPADDAHALLAGAAARTLQSLQLLSSSGQLRDVEVLVDDLSDDPDVGGVVLTLRDVTERAALERQLRQRAFHDDLTGLANRSLFLDRLAHALERREPGCAVLFCDLDDFKAVNDGLGHAAGDLVLVETARRLQRCVRSGDTVGRVGGDEFAILLEDGDETTASALAERIVAAVAEPLRIGGKEVVMSVSIGVAVSDGRNADTLLRDADTAMYAAKRRGRHHVAVFDPRGETTADRLALAHELRHALRHGGLVVHYQPIVTLDDRAVVGVEALVRWQHPTRGLLGPGAFLGVAERAGLVPDVGRVVLASACEQARRWSTPDGRPLDLHVNVSPFQLREGTLVADVLSALDHSGLPAQRLVLELTEEALVDGRPEILERLQVLRQRGVRIAIDDFGTGYSSLGYLQRLPIDAVKIDRSFVQALDDPTGASLLAGTLDLLDRLGLPAVLEGIETDGQLAAARAAGSRYGQGFLLGRPADAAAVRARFGDPHPADAD